MNINELIDRIRESMKHTFLVIKDTFIEQWKIYACYILATSFCCILLAGMSKKEDFPKWYCYAPEHNVISKAVEYEEQKMEHKYGLFLTHYRFRQFGETKPHTHKQDVPMVALTFDDGPNPEYTKRVLEVLEANQAHATFFVVGTNAEQYPGVLREIVASGNEIGNHTYNHANLTEIDSADVEMEIDKVNRAVKKATGQKTNVIRPPYGAYNDMVLNQLKQPVVLWDLDTEDWDSRDANTIVEHILAEVEDGDIILMHDIYDSTAEAVELLLPRLKELGYEVVSVTEMARYKGKELELHKAYGGVK